MKDISISKLSGEKSTFFYDLCSFPYALDNQPSCNDLAYGNAYLFNSEGKCTYSFTNSEFTQTD